MAGRAMLSPQADAVTLQSRCNLTGVVRPKCQLMVAYGAARRVRPAFRADSDGELTFCGCLDMVVRVILPLRAHQRALYLENVS
jgi:hypothetical protein